MTKQMIKVNLSMQFLATRILRSVGAKSFSTWVLQARDGEGPLSELGSRDLCSLFHHWSRSYSCQTSPSCIVTP